MFTHTRARKSAARFKCLLTHWFIQVAEQQLCVFRIVRSLACTHLFLSSPSLSAHLNRLWRVYPARAGVLALENRLRSHSSLFWLFSTGCGSQRRTQSLERCEGFQLAERAAVSQLVRSARSRAVARSLPGRTRRQPGILICALSAAASDWVDDWDHF